MGHTMLFHGSHTAVKMFWPWRCKAPVLSIPMPATAPTAAFGVSPNQPSSILAGVVTAPVSGPSPALAPIRTPLDSLDPDSGLSSISSSPSKVRPSVSTQD